MISALLSDRVFLVSELYAYPSFPWRDNYFSAHFEVNLPIFSSVLFLNLWQGHVCIFQKSPRSIASLVIWCFTTSCSGHGVSLGALKYTCVLWCFFLFLLSPPAGCCSLTLSECLLGASQGNSFFDCIMKTSDSTKHLFVHSFICKLIALICSSFSLSLSLGVSHIPCKVFNGKLAAYAAFLSHFSSAEIVRIFDHYILIWE